MTTTNVSYCVAPRAGADNDRATKTLETKQHNLIKSKRAIFSFQDARKIARNYGFDTREEFLSYSCPGAYQLPKNPDVIWADEWKGWDDFLGVMLPFEEGRNVARALESVSKMEDYLALFETKVISDDDKASRLPYRPDLRYKDKWLGWENWLQG
mmetsp:Transcript_59046/g.70423  ORF Transcript_59046/g.70423 Transcript_59046/m.70423 type:complete len:155 (-) Transcript_59046:870-1334(-)